MFDTMRTEYLIEIRIDHVEVACWRDVINRRWIGKWVLELNSLFDQALAVGDVKISHMRSSELGAAERSNL
jgi:hypothetical protein